MNLHPLSRNPVTDLALCQTCPFDDLLLACAALKAAEPDTFAIALSQQERKIDLALRTVLFSRCLEADTFGTCNISEAISTFKALFDTISKFEDEKFRKLCLDDDDCDSSQRFPSDLETNLAFGIKWFETYRLQMQDEAQTGLSASPMRSFQRAWLDSFAEALKVHRLENFYRSGATKNLFDPGTFLKCCPTNEALFEAVNLTKDCCSVYANKSPQKLPEYVQFLHTFSERYVTAGTLAVLKCSNRLELEPQKISVLELIKSLEDYAAYCEEMGAKCSGYFRRPKRSTEFYLAILKDFIGGSSDIPQHTTAFLQRLDRVATPTYKLFSRTEIKREMILDFASAKLGVELSPTQAARYLGRIEAELKRINDCSCRDVVFFLWEGAHQNFPSGTYINGYELVDMSEDRLLARSDNGEVEQLGGYARFFVSDGGSYGNQSFAALLLNDEITVDSETTIRLPETPVIYCTPRQVSRSFLLPGCLNSIDGLCEAIQTFNRGGFAVELLLAS